MNKATFDPARRLDLYFRCDRAGSKNFVFAYSDGTPYSFIYEEFQFYIYRYQGEKKVLLELLTVSNQSTLTSSITVAQSNIDAAEYYYELFNSQTNETWLCGDAIFHNGKFDGVSTDTENVTIQINGEEINITLEVTPASASGGSGTVTSVAGFSPLFTISNPTTTPTPVAINQNANLVYAGPATGAAAAPTFRALVAADMPSGFFTGHVIENSGTPLTQRANLNFTNGLTSSDNTPDTDVRLGGTTTNLSLSGTVTAIGLEVIPSGNFQVYTSGGSPVISLGISNTGVEPGIVMGGDPTPANSFLSLRSAWLDDFGDSWRFDFRRVSAIWTRGSINSALPVYAADYSANYTDRTWVDRGYVLGAKTYTGLQTFRDDYFILQDDGDLTKQAQFQLSSITAGQTRTLTVPDASGTIALTSNIILPAQGGTGIANNNASTLTISGNFATTLTVTGVTGITLPTSGTLATLAGAESLTNKKLGSLTTDGFVKTSGGDGTLSTTPDLTTTLSVNNTITQAGFNVTMSGIGKWTFSPTTGASSVSGMSVGSIAGSPTTVANGDIWYSSTSNSFLVGKVGTTHIVVTTGPSGLTNTRICFGSSTTGMIQDSANLTFVTNRILGTTLYLTLSAGTATAGTGPLKMTAGTNLTTAEAGTFEYNGADLFFTKSGTTRGTVLVSTAVTTEAVASDTTLTITHAGTTYKLLARA